MYVEVHNWGEHYIVFFSLMFQSIHIILNQFFFKQEKTGNSVVLGTPPAPCLVQNQTISLFVFEGFPYKSMIKKKMLDHWEQVLRSEASVLPYLLQTSVYVLDDDCWVIPFIDYNGNNTGSDGFR